MARRHAGTAGEAAEARGKEVSSGLSVVQQAMQISMRRRAGCLSQAMRVPKAACCVVVVGAVCQYSDYTQSLAMCLVHVPTT